jgi:hypothetical protein
MYMKFGETMTQRVAVAGLLFDPLNVTASHEDFFPLLEILRRDPDLYQIFHRLDNMIEAGVESRPFIEAWESIRELAERYRYLGHDQFVKTTGILPKLQLADWAKVAAYLRIEYEKLAPQLPTPPPETESVTRSEPGWLRLDVRERNGYGIAALDGREYQLRGTKDAGLLKALQAEQGDPISATVLESVLGEKPSRIFNRLAPEIQAIIDKPGRGAAGYRML